MEEDLKDSDYVGRQVGGLLIGGRIRVVRALLVAISGVRGQGRECIPVTTCQVDYSMLRGDGVGAYISLEDIEQSNLRLAETSD